jgi:hypothetical protein
LCGIVMSDSPPKQKSSAAADQRAAERERLAKERLAKALRANLARRKAQARARTPEPDASGDEG